MKVLIEFKKIEKADSALSDKTFTKDLGIKITGKSKHSPLIYAEANSNQIGKLAKNPNIKKIIFDRPLHMSEFTQIETDENLFMLVEDSIPLINAEAAWNAGYKGQGIKLAVLDSGVWESHPWLVGKTVGRWSAYGDDPSLPIEPHGTHVAGIAMKVAPEAELLNIKILDDSGSCTISIMLDGIEAAVDLGADVINLSIGGRADFCTDGDPVDNVIRDYSDTVIFCCAAGNRGQYGASTIDYPGHSKYVICCGAVDKAGVVAYFSSRGPSPCAEIKPDCVSPGVAIVSSVPPNATDSYNGTSMATPMMAGMFACVLSKGFIGGRSNLELLLIESIPGTKDNNYGYGHINVKTACDYVTGEPDEPPPDEPTPPPSAPLGDTVYTGYNLVRKRVSHISSSLEDDDIIGFIIQAEGFLDTIMKESFRKSFNITKHGLIRSTCEAMAAYSCITYDVTQFSSNPQAALSADLFHNIIEKNIKLLSDKRNIIFMKNLSAEDSSSSVYANYSLVRKRVARISTALTDSDIMAFILQAEGVIDIIMKESFREIFNPNKHGLIQETCEAMAAYDCIAYDISSFTSVSQAALAANLLWELIEKNTKLLSDKRNVEIMKVL